MSKFIWSAAVLLLFTGGMVIGVILSRATTEVRYQQQAIEHGFAEYNQQTGQWQWKKGE